MMTVKCIHVDCGRKFFSPEDLHQLIDLSAEAGFNSMELAFGNDGFRFFLQVMTPIPNSGRLM